MSSDDNIKFQVVDDEDQKLFGTSQPSASSSSASSAVAATKISHANTSGSDFEKQIVAFFQKNRVKLYILTPCFASLCYVNYIQSLMITIELFRRFNIQ